MPGSAQERNRQGFADAEEADDELGSTHQCRLAGGSVEHHRQRIVDDLRASTEFHRHAGAQLDVHELVERKARSERDQVERRTGWDARHTAPGLARTLAEQLAERVRLGRFSVDRVLVQRLRPVPAVCMIGRPA